MDTLKIGFVGLGAMGTPMAHNIDLAASAAAASVLSALQHRGGARLDSAMVFAVLDKPATQEDAEEGQR